MQIEAQGVEPLLAQLSEELRTKSYRPLPCRQVNIPKEGGKTRGLKIPAIRDRVVQGAVRLIQESAVREIRTLRLTRRGQETEPWTD